MQLQSGTLLQEGKYKIEKVLGQGGFGITYLATHELLDRQVCIKEFFFKEHCERGNDATRITLGTQSNHEIVERFMTKFLKEARTISQLDHPNIIRIHDIFRENNTAYYVMDYIAGESLNDMISRDGAMTESMSIAYIKQVACALDFIHQRGINHLDIKPANIMIRERDNKAILIDFGLSKHYDAQGGQTSTTPIGISYGYAPMEQYNPGGVSTFSAQTDIYSLGATLYKLVTGNTPPQAMDILNDGLPQLPESLSSSMRGTITQAMQVRKSDRPENVSSFLNLLSNNSYTDFSNPQYQPKLRVDETTKIIADHEECKKVHGLSNNDIEAQSQCVNLKKKVSTKSEHSTKVDIYLVSVLFLTVLIHIISLGFGSSMQYALIYTFFFACMISAFFLNKELKLYNKDINKIQSPIIHYLLTFFVVVSLYLCVSIFVDQSYLSNVDIGIALSLYYTSFTLIPIGLAQLLLWDKSGIFTILLGLGAMLLDVEYGFYHICIFFCLLCLPILLSIKQNGISTWMQLVYGDSFDKHKLLYLHFVVIIISVCCVGYYTPYWRDFICYYI